MPYLGEHSANLISVTTEHTRVNRTKGSGNRKVQGVIIPENISVIWFVQSKDNKETLIPQALRFQEKEWTPVSTASWLNRHKVKHSELELATPSKRSEENPVPCYTHYLDKTKKQLDIILHDEIGFWGMQSKEFHKLLLDNKDVSVISIDINSPGGSVFDGFSIYNALKSHRSEVRVKVSGVAASIASVIAMAGDIIEMPETSMMMMHKPFIDGIFGADSIKLRKQAEALDKMEKSIILAYKTRLGKTNKEIEGMLAETTWLSANEAHELGLADLVTEEGDVLDCFDFNNYEYGEIPETVMNLYDIERNDNIEEYTEPTNGKTEISKLIDVIKKMLNSKKESDTMADKELEQEVKDLKAKNEKLQGSVEKLTDTNNTLTTTVQNQLASAETSAVEGRKVDFKSFCDKLVGEGKIRPADVDTHVDTMEEKYQKDKEGHKDGKTETPKVDTYKTMLSELPKSLIVGDKHVADKHKRGDGQNNQGTVDPVDVAAKKLLSEMNKAGTPITYSQAVSQACQEDPSLYDAANQTIEQ